MTNVSKLYDYPVRGRRNGPGDSGGDGGDNESMTEPITRPELDAKLETIETRMDGRIARIESSITEIRDSQARQQRSVWFAAGTIIVAMIATVFAAVTLGFNAFDSGRDTAQLAAEARAETTAALSEIRQIVTELKQQTTPSPD